MDHQFPNPSQLTIVIQFQDVPEASLLALMAAFTVASNTTASQGTQTEIRSVDMDIQAGQDAMETNTWSTTNSNPTTPCLPSTPECPGHNGEVPTSPTFPDSSASGSLLFSIMSGTASYATTPTQSSTPAAKIDEDVHVDSIVAEPPLTKSSTSLINSQMPVESAVESAVEPAIESALESPVGSPDEPPVESALEFSVKSSVDSIIESPFATPIGSPAQPEVHSPTTIWQSSRCSSMTTFDSGELGRRSVRMAHEVHRRGSDLSLKAGEHITGPRVCESLYNLEPDVRDRCFSTGAYPQPNISTVNFRSPYVESCDETDVPESDDGRAHTHGSYLPGQSFGATEVDLDQQSTTDSVTRRVLHGTTELQAQLRMFEERLRETNLQVCEQDDHIRFLGARLQENDTEVRHHEVQIRHVGAFLRRNKADMQKLEVQLRRVIGAVVSAQLNRTKSLDSQTHGGVAPGRFAKLKAYGLRHWPVLVCFLLLGVQAWSITASPEVHLRSWMACARCTEYLQTLSYRVSSL